MIKLPLLGSLYFDIPPPFYRLTFIYRASNTTTEEAGRDCVGAGDGTAGEARDRKWGAGGVDLYIRRVSSSPWDFL